mgnify:CR=1 FL=1
MEITWIKSGNEEYLVQEHFNEVINSLDSSIRLNHNYQDIFAQEQYLSEFRALISKLNSFWINLPEFNGTLYLPKNKLHEIIYAERKEKSLWIDPSQHSEESRDNMLKAIDDLETKLRLKDIDILEKNLATN